MADDSLSPTIEALINEPARARLLGVLVSGIALTASELAGETDMTPSTALAHLEELREAGLLDAWERRGRPYYRLRDERAASRLRGLPLFRDGGTPLRRRPGPRQPALRHARVCYGHLAGELGVALFDLLAHRGLVEAVDDDLALTEAGARYFTDFGIDVAALGRARRPVCRPCLDWSERRTHLAGGLGSALLERFGQLGWAEREPDSRVVTFSPDGERALLERFGVAVPR